MPAYGDLVLPDGLATPVDRTFARMGRSNGGDVVNWAYRLGAMNNWHRISLQHTTNKMGLTKVRVKVQIPTLETVGSGTGNGVIAIPGVAYTNSFDGTFFLPARGTTQERQHLVAFSKAMLVNAIISGAITLAEPVF